MLSSTTGHGKCDTGNSLLRRMEAKDTADSVTVPAGVDSLALLTADLRNHRKLTVETLIQLQIIRENLHGNPNAYVQCQVQTKIL